MDWVIVTQEFGSLCVGTAQEQWHTPVSAVREQNIQVAAGVVGGPPLAEDAAKFQYTVSALGRLAEPSQFGEIVVKTGEDGRITRVRDVARVELGAADYSSGITFDGSASVGLGIFQLPGSNSIDTADAIYARMAELSESFPPGLDYSIPYDTTIFVRNSVRDVIKTLIEAVFLVVMVVLVFLQSWRASLIPLIAISVSLIGAFAVMAAFGFSINNLSLFGIVLAVGIVVDDAIVVVENIERWIEHGLPPREAAHKAMDAAASREIQRVGVDRLRRAAGSDVHGIQDRSHGIHSPAGCRIPARQSSDARRGYDRPNRADDEPARTDRP